MSHASQAAREDLAFLRTMAADADPLPAEFGGHLAAPGLIFGACTFAVWAILAGYIMPSDPKSWLHWKIAAIGGALYVPSFLWLRMRGRRADWGATKRLFGAVWGAMGAMSAATLISLVLAQGRTGAPFLLLWPSMALVLWGGSWVVVASARRQVWQGLVATACFITAAVCSVMIGKPEQWLVLAFAIIFLMAGPGLVISLQARNKAAHAQSK